MKLKEKDYYLGFNIFKGIGVKRFAHLLKKFGSAKSAWKASEKNLLKTNIPDSIIKNFITFREKFDLSAEIIRLQKELIRFIIVDDKEYPENLKKIKFPPPLLYIRGKILPQDQLALSVVGSRKITPYGREVTEQFARGLVAHNFTIVSGLARGVDSCAHRIALGNQARTIAVLGSSLNNIYPPEHRALAEKIVKNNQGAIISQFPLTTQALRGHFPARNKIISGLSLGVLVTEGAAHSGTKSTAQHCIRQKRQLFAVPGPITSPLSEGPADLIKIGAKMVTKTKDILEELEIKNVETNAKTPAKKKIHFQNKEEEKIWQTLTGGGKHIDAIIRETSLNSAQVLSLLTEMEIKGKVKNIGQGNYILV